MCVKKEGERDSTNWSVSFLLRALCKVPFNYSSKFSYTNDIKMGVRVSTDEFWVDINFELIGKKTTVTNELKLT